MSCCSTTRGARCRSCVVGSGYLPPCEREGGGPGEAAVRGTARTGDTCPGGHVSGRVRVAVRQRPAPHTAPTRDDATCRGGAPPGIGDPDPAVGPAPGPGG